MQATFEKLVAEIQLSFSLDILKQLAVLLQQQVDASLASFVATEYPSLLSLEQQIWEVLSQGPEHWFTHPYSCHFLQALGSFNKKLVFQPENIADEMKVALLVDQSIETIDGIFARVESCLTEDDPSITFISLWFDNLSYLVHEYPQFSRLPVIIHINEHFGRHFLLGENFQSYLRQLQQSPLSSAVFAAKQLFYMKTCPFSLNAYFYAEPSTFSCARSDVLQSIGADYLQVVHVQSAAVQTWSTELLACVAHLIGFMRAFLWWGKGSGVRFEGLFTSEKMLCDYVQDLFHITEYQPLHQRITAQWLHDETILMDSILLSLINIVQSQNINWFFRSITELPGVLLNLAEASAYYRIYLCAYGILSEVLTEERLKELKITDSIRIFFFNMLEQAWRHPMKIYRQIPITYFLRGFLNLSKNDFIQEGTAKSQKTSLFVDMSAQYPMVFNIIWALSFNNDIQQQLLSNTAFIDRLVHLAANAEDEDTRKATSGILWNLNIQQHSSSVVTEEDSFDIMMSYSHKDKVLCKQLYDELTRRGYRVWIDFDQMRGNVMDAMANAIDRSRTIILCMSEHYRKSNFCRAEAHYAFQQQRHIVPVLMQKHYKADGWLLFLVGQLLYVDFMKYEFSRAMEMLVKELKNVNGYPVNTTEVPPTEDTDTAVRGSNAAPINSITSTAPDAPILQWTPSEAQAWLAAHNLPQLAQLLIDCDGRSLMYLNKYVNHGAPSQVLTLLQDDSHRRLRESLSLIELCRFQSLMHQHSEGP